MGSSSGGYSGDGESGNLVTEQVRQGTQQAVEGTQQAISQVADQAKQQAQSMLQQQKSQAEDTLHTVSSALRQTGDSLRQQNQGMIAGAIDMAADRVDGLCTYVENKDLGGLMDDVENMARNNAALFLAGGFAVGLMAARFLKSSRPSTGRNYPYGGPRDYAANMGYPNASYGDSRYGYGSIDSPSYGYGTPPAYSDVTTPSYGSGTPNGDTVGVDTDNIYGSTAAPGFAGTRGLSETDELTADDTISEYGNVQTDRPH